jgi:putative ATP-binding cassette transporter
MFKLASSLKQLMLPEDRRQWPILLGASLVSGLSRSLFLALVSTAVASRGDGLSSLYALGVVVLIACIVMADFFSAVRGREVANRLAMRLRNSLLDKVGSANLRLIEQEQPSRLHYHLMHTIGVVAGTYFVLLGFANSLVTLTFNFIYIGWLSWIGLVSALLISLVGVKMHWFFEQRNVERRRRLDELSNNNSGCHMAYLLGYKELRLSRSKEADYRRQIDGINAEYLDKSVMEARVSTTGGMATSLFQYLAIAAAALLLPLIVEMDPMIVMQLLAAILFTIGPLEGVVNSFASFGRAQVAMDNLHRLTDAVSATRECPPPADHPGLPPFESLALRGVTFAFDAPAGAAAESFSLGPVDFSLRKGEVVFVVGGNGSGKTVLMRLLTGLYRPVDGEILFNGRPLTVPDRQAYREQFSTVFNDFFLFAELLGRRDTAREEILDLLDQYDLAGKSDFRNGRFTSINLSTGQRKRLALLVARLEACPLLVLDEFGADQDPEHRERFYREWLPLLRSAGRTLVVVSHDDRYFDAADRVVHMDFGKIARVVANC